MLKLSAPHMGEEEIAAAANVLRSGNLVQGKECERFEEELASYLGIAEVVLVTSGTAALHLSLISLGIGTDDAVLVPNFSFVATTNVVKLVGARPVFIDVDKTNYNITKESILDAINRYDGDEKLRAIIPVHNFGCPVDMTMIMKLAKQYNFTVIEDAACAIGAEHNSSKVGVFGETGCFSFHPRKIVTTGEGGAICTNNRVLAENLRLLRNHGIDRSRRETDYVLAGYNYRMTDFQAAIGRVQLRKLSGALFKRRQLKTVYLEGLSEVESISLPQNIVGHSWQTFMITLDDNISRPEVIDYLRKNRFECSIGSQSMVSLKTYAEYFKSYMEKWNSLTLFKQGLALPFCEQYKEEQLNQFVNLLKSYLQKT